MRTSPSFIPATKLGKVGVAALAGLALVAAPLVATPAFANTAGTGVVISEVYVNGGSASATYTNKYVELFNPGSTSVDLSTYSLQYRPATQSGDPSSSYVLTGSIAAGGYDLIQGGSNGAVGAPLPSPNQTTSFNPAAAGGQVFLASQTTLLTAPTANSAGVVDMLGYGTATTFEGSAPAVKASVTTAISRAADESDTDVNSADFVTVEPTPGTVNPGAAPPVDPVPATIEQIQGSTDTSPFAGELVTTSGVVTAAYPTGGFKGYYIQAPGTGGSIDVASHTTSDAVFVYSPDTVDSVAIGDHVEVTGDVSEFHGTTEVAVDAGDVTTLTDAVTAPTPASVTVPLTADGRESFEGMLVAPKGDFTITDNYDLNQYGEVALNPGTAPLITPTQAVEPGAPAVAYAADNVARTIVLDDGASINYLTSATGQKTPLPYLSATSPMRVGTPATFVKPVIFEYRNNAWNFQPTQQLTPANAGTVQPATFTDTRTSGPADVGGDVTLASFNVLNYFPTTGDQVADCTYYNDRDGNPITVKDGCNPRGAANAENLARQQAKIVKAINALGADVVSLEEIENSVRLGKNRDFALSTLVAALNADAGSNVWSFVPSPLSTPTSQDVIRTAFIYKSAVVGPVGDSVILDDPAFVNARQPLAQEFKRVGGAASDVFLAIVNHFKSKGSGDGANADQGDGQGASNVDRVAQAKALVAFADRMKASTGTSRVFLSGDFNSYLKEDPIDVLTAAGYVDLGSTKTSKYTYAFDGAVGSLDHIFVSGNAVSDVASVDIWNVNAYESVAFEYSRYNYNATNFYEANPYRSSDHDPILVGINLRTEIAANVPKIVGKAKVGATLTAKAGTWDPKPVTLTYRWLNDGNSIKGATHSTYKLKKTDKGDRISVRVTGTKTGYTTVVKTSASVKIYLALKATPKPKISGTAKVGHTLAVTAGKWKPAKVHLKYHWYRNGVAIKGADSKKYHLKSADKGKKITIKVTGSKRGYLTESETRSIAKIR